MKYEIEIKGLPEGWRAVAFRHANNETVFDCGQVVQSTKSKYPCLIVEKIKPRRIVLEETKEDNKVNNLGVYDAQHFTNGLSIYNQPKIWREVKEDEEL